MQVTRNDAYDLSIFENRQPKSARSQLRVAEPDKKARRKRDLTWLKQLSLAALAIALIWGVLVSHAQVTELSGAIEAAQVALNEEQSEYDYLSLTLESQTNLTSVEEVARTQLGMTKMDKSQVSYISLETEDAVYKPEGEVGSFLSGLESAFMSLMEYIAP